MILGYSVEHFGSDPDSDNDDCWYGNDYATLEEATAAYKAGSSDPDVAWLQLVVIVDHTPRLVCYGGIPTMILDSMVDPICKRQIRAMRSSGSDDDAWRQEIAMQAGMAFGCGGYNDAMGY